MLKIQGFSVFYRLIRCSLITILLLSLTACGGLISSAKKEFAEDLSATILAHDEPETVRQAIPTYLILVSSLIRSDQTNIDLLISGSRLYGSYASVFVEETGRKIILARRSFAYAEQAMCIKLAKSCTAKIMSYHEFEQTIKDFKKEDASILFAYGAAWTGLIQANRADWNAVAELPKAKAIISKVLELDEGINNGDAHLYMGVMESLLPPAMGGKPDIAKEHFERALEISKRKNLMALLMYAEKYARLLFNRELHDSLLNELLAVDIRQSKSLLIDTIARVKAKELLANADDYF
ncbi:MAG: TRAP transporter TatT component family protein [Gammaproteobacteria bacterium]|nr:TRAP transporter TatT component family protein [Gammaproteobacteria bacterium]